VYKDNRDASKLILIIVKLCKIVGLATRRWRPSELGPKRCGNQYRAHMAETAPHVLDFKAELIVDGRQLERPVNYCLTRIVPSPGVATSSMVCPGIGSGRKPMK
jgi:hypothetical protein